MQKLYFFTLLLLLANVLPAQENLLMTNAEAYEILKGEYDPAPYFPAVVTNQPAEVIDGIVAQVSPDSLKDYLFELSSFENRNTGSDTTSADFGIGAARRWSHHKMQQFSERQEGRLLTGYFQFDQDICGMGQHRNVVAVLPGVGPNRHESVLVVRHIDSRCAGPCDIDCMAHGAEDNGSGTAMVLELAR